MKKENLLKLLIAFLVLSIALNVFLLFCLAPRKALLKEIKENKDLLAQSQKKRKCVPGTNFFELYPFLEEVKKNIENTENDRVSAIISIDGDRIGKLVKEKGFDAAGYVMTQLHNYIEQIARDNKNLLVCSLGEQSDEIVIFIPNKKTEKEIVDFTAKLLDGWRNQKLNFNDEDLHVTISAGIAFYPKHSEDNKDLYTKADLALQQAKDAGRDRYAIYEGK